MTAVDAPRVHNFSTEDMQHAQHAVQQTYFPHELHTYSPRDNAISTIRTINLGSISVGLIQWGNDIGIECSYDDGYQINIVLDGELNWERSGRRCTASKGEAAVFPPKEFSPITHWGAGSTILGIRVAEDLMNRHVATGWATREVFAPPKLDLRDTVGNSWIHYVRQSGQQIISQPGVTESYGFQEAFTSAIITPLANFLCQNAEQTRSPYMITRVRRAVEAEPARSWKLADLAGVAGVSPRRLQQVFKEFLSTTPSRWLVSVRLDQTHRILTDPQDTRNVSEVSLACGFSHLSRFAQEFQQYFGHLPSHVLRSIRK